MCIQFNRQANQLYMCNIAQIVNVLQSLLLTEGAHSEKCVRTTTYYAFQVFKAHREKTAARVEASAPSAGALPVSASRGAGELVLSFVNPYADRDVSASCRVPGGGVRSGSAEILHHADVNAFNSFEQPDTVVVQKHSVKVNQDLVQVELPRMSVVTARLQMG